MRATTKKVEHRTHAATLGENSTYADWLAEATTLLREGGGREGAELERLEAYSRARLLLDWVAGQRYAHLFKPEAPLGKEAAKKLRRALDAALAGQPLPYIIGNREFWKFSFEVGPGVLIPRPETEVLVEAALARLPKKPLKVADLGTGSGCIAISLAKTRADALVFATDLSLRALEIAEKNAARLEAPIQFLLGQNGEWAAPLQEFAPFDALVSNPPYIAAAQIETLQTEVRDHEPRLALDGGADGLDSYRLLARQARDILRPDGFLALELGAGQFESVGALFLAQNWRLEPPIFDPAGHARVMVTRPGEDSA